jgi:hypothetical protein
LNIKCKSYKRIGKQKKKKRKKEEKKYKEAVGKPSGPKPEEAHGPFTPHPEPVPAFLLLPLMSGTHQSGSFSFDEYSAVTEPARVIPSPLNSSLLPARFELSPCLQVAPASLSVSPHLPLTKSPPGRRILPPEFAVPDDEHHRFR